MLAGQAFPSFMETAQVNGEYATKEYVVPMATHEGQGECVWSYLGARRACARLV